MLNGSLLLSLLLLFSCASSKIKHDDINGALRFIKVTGEGRGRLGLDDKSNVFSFESLLKDQRDWVLAAAIPLHGEEVLILHDIKSVRPGVTSEDSLGKRIQNKKFIEGVRALVRFLLAEELSLKRECAGDECLLLGDVFKVNVTEKMVKVSYSLDHHLFELTAENLTGPFFGRTNFYLKSPQAEAPIMSLELFWK